MKAYQLCSCTLKFLLVYYFFANFFGTLSSAVSNQMSMIMFSGRDGDVRPKRPPRVFKRVLRQNYDIIIDSMPKVSMMCRLLLIKASLKCGQWGSPRDALGNAKLANSNDVKRTRL